MTKELLRSAGNLEAVDVYRREVAKKLGIAYYDKISLVRLQKSPAYHRNIFRKMRNYLRKKVCSHMHFPVVISQENLWRTWCMRHREILF